MAAAAAIGGAARALTAIAQFEYRRPGPLIKSVDVVVPRGGARSVGAVLAAAGVIDHPLRFRIAVAMTVWQGPLRAAEFSFAAHSSLERVLAVLRSGAPVRHFLTIPEGVTGARVAVLLAQAVGLEGAVPVPPEGYVLPQTYSYERGMRREDALSRAKADLDRVLAREWAERDRGLGPTSPRQAMIVASMVERETAKDEERPLVARVFYNRLRLGMRLQSDPTVVYGASGGFGFLARPLSRADLELAGPYNTYAVSGLPAGPICNPGEASIKAALHPGRSDALYFVADGSGGHAFADSLPEHERNVARSRGRAP